MTTTRTDLAFGRRGGGWVPDGATATRVDRAPVCTECGDRMTVGQRGRHHVCDPSTTVGTVCTCPPGCTVTRVGDGPRECAIGCTPCRVNAGRKWDDLWTEGDR